MIKFLTVATAYASHWSDVLSYEDLYVDFRVNGYPFYNEGLGTRINFRDSAAWYAISGFDTDISQIQEATSKLSYILHQPLGYEVPDIDMGESATVILDRITGFAKLDCFHGRYVYGEAYLEFSKELTDFLQDPDIPSVRWEFGTRVDPSLIVFRDEVQTYCQALGSRWFMFAKELAENEVNETQEEKLSHIQLRSRKVYKNY